MLSIDFHSKWGDIFIKRNIITLYFLILFLFVLQFISPVRSTMVSFNWAGEFQSNFFSKKKKHITVLSSLGLTTKDHYLEQQSLTQCKRGHLPSLCLCAGGLQEWTPLDHSPLLVPFCFALLSSSATTTGTLSPYHSGICTFIPGETGGLCLQFFHH